MEVVPETVSLRTVLQHQICNFHIKYGMSHIETTRVPSLHLTMSATIQCIQRLLKITSSIDAKTEPHKGRNMVSIDLSARAQTGCVVTKGTRLCLESVGLSVLLKMNAVQFTLDGFELLFLSTISTF